MTIAVTHSTPADASFSASGATAWDANHTLTGVGTMATQNANSVTITGGTLNGVAIGQSVAGDAIFDVLTANVTNLTNVTSSAGIAITGTFTGSSPSDGLVMDYSTGWGRFSAFGGDGFQWYNAGLATTKLMEISSAGALVTLGTVTANGVLLTGNLGTVTSVTGTSPVVSSGGATPAISMPAATTSVSGYLTSTDWNTFNGKQAAGTYVNSVSATAPITSSGGVTPTIAIPAATGSVNGYLTSTDWTTFNNKSNTNGTVTSVAAITLGTTGTDLSSTVANGTTTPVITLQVPTASASNRGALSAADWTTFNGKAAAFTYTSTYIPYGQGTTTPNQSSSLTFDGTTQVAPIQRASNGIIVNKMTVSASYSIASGDSGMSVGPVTVASGQSVTVSSGSRWVVL